MSDEVREKTIEQIINMNYRVLTLIGYATALLEGLPPEKKDDKYKWFRQAIVNVVYLDKPLPPEIDNYPKDENHRGLNIKDGKVESLK